MNDKTLQQLWEEHKALCPGGVPPDQEAFARTAFFIGMMAACGLALETTKLTASEFALELAEKIEAQMAVEALNNE